MKKMKGKSKGTSMPVMVGTEASVSIRKISNGFIIDESGTKGGKYVSKQTYTPTNPLESLKKK